MGTDKLQPMQAALPIMYQLALANTEAMMISWAEVDLADMAQVAKLAGLHARWIHLACQHLAKAGDFACTVRYAEKPAGGPAPLPFTDMSFNVPLVPLVGPRQLTFNAEFAKALKAIRPMMSGPTGGASYRHAWFARCLAAAALTAHLAISSPDLPAAVVLDASPGEDEVTAKVALRAVLADFPANLTVELPIYMGAHLIAQEELLSQIRRGFAALRGPEISPREAYRLAGRMTDLLAYAVSAQTDDDGRGRTACQFLEEASEFMVQHRVFQSGLVAQEALLDIGIGDDFKVRNSNSTVKLRLTTKNSKHQAAFRGKTIYIDIWGEACLAAGVLTEPLIRSMTSSRTQIHKLLNLLKPPGDQGSAVTQSCDSPAVAGAVTPNLKAEASDD